LKTRPTVLSIAGYDPSGGAGLLADIKTFEAIKVYGLGVATALTWQNESEFVRVQWLPLQDILSQIELLLRKSRVDYVKIGLLENAAVFGQIIDFLLDKNPKVKIVWDPILSASAGFDFHSTSLLSEWKENLFKLYLFTPNWNELQWLAQSSDMTKAAEELAALCHVFLKGGHRTDKVGYDILAMRGSDIEVQRSAFKVQSSQAGLAKTYSFKPKNTTVWPKHGSGCVLSSAITAYLAKGYPLHKACLHAKTYVTQFLGSSEGLLGHHKF